MNGTKNKTAYNNGIISIYLRADEKIPDGFTKGLKPRAKETNILANEKRKATCLKKYGVSNVNKVKSVREKIKKTCTAKYNESCYFKTKEFIEYNKEIQEERYGGIGMASAEIAEKIKTSTLNNWGVDCIFKLLEFVEMNKQNQIKKYGGVGFASNVLTQKSIDTTMKKNNLTSIEEYKRFIFEATAKSMCKKYGANEWKDLPFFTIGRKVYIYNDVKFDSLPELAFYIYNLDNNKKIIKNIEKYFVYYLYNDEHTYFPDFIVDGEFIEIKGDHFFKEDGTMCNSYDHSWDELYEAKHQCMIKNNIKILTSDNYNFYIDYCSKKYENCMWFTNFINNTNKGGDINEKNG